MATATEKRIYRLSAVCGFLAALSFIVPRFVRNAEGGFASGATAVLVFLASLFVTALFSLYLFFVTLRAYPDLSMTSRLAGIGPSIVLVAALALLFGYLRY